MSRGRRSFVTPLDRYVAAEFLRIFLAALLASPVLVTVIDLVDNMRKYQDRHIPAADIAMGYVYGIPDTLFMVLPAATLIATVFSIATFTRHSEINAAKASGISFYRFIVPILLMAVGATALTMTVGELTPPANRERLNRLEGSVVTKRTQRFNFVFANEAGRMYKVQTLDVPAARMEFLEIEERGSEQRPGVLITAQAASWTDDQGWLLNQGVVHVIPDRTRDIVLQFDSLSDRALTEAPADLQATERKPEEMNFGQLSRFIVALERSGNDVNSLKVDRMLKLAIPVTCIIIALFGAPLATSSLRGGTAFGVGVSLGTTIVFLVLLQMTKALGSKGIVSPELAAWTPNIAVGILALILLIRVRT